MLVVVLHIGVLFHLGGVVSELVRRAEDEFMVEQAVVVDDEPDLLALLHLDPVGHVQHLVAVLAHDDTHRPGWFVRISVFAERKRLMAERMCNGKRDERHDDGSRSHDDGLHALISCILSTGSYLRNAAARATSAATRALRP